MLKLNSKAVELKVIKYLEEIVNEMDGGLEELINDYNQHKQFDSKHYNNPIDFYISMGTYPFEIYYDEHRDLLNEWLESNPEETKKYDNDKVYQTFIGLVERVFLKHYKLTKVIKYDYRKIPNSKAYITIQKVD